MAKLKIMGLPRRFSRLKKQNHKKPHDRHFWGGGQRFEFSASPRTQVTSTAVRNNLLHGRNLASNSGVANRPLVLGTVIYEKSNQKEGEDWFEQTPIPPTPTINLISFLFVPLQISSQNKISLKKKKILEGAICPPHLPHPQVTPMTC